MATRTEQIVVAFAFPCVLAQQIAGRRIWRTGKGQKKNSKIQESIGMIRFGNSYD
jgi:hypothetical protein